MLAGTGCAAHRQGARHAATFVQIEPDAGIVLSNGDAACSLREQRWQRTPRIARDACWSAATEWATRRLRDLDPVGLGV